MTRSYKLNEKLYPDIIVSELKKYITKKIYKKTDLPKFIFLCGKGFSNEEEEKMSNRNIVIDFFLKRNRKDLYFVYAEKLWDVNFGNKIDLLTYENFLATLSDGIIIFVESYGSACELGAFSMKDELIKKMLVFIDKKHENQKSFIQEGPVKKIKNINSNYITYTDLSAILSTPEVFSRLDQFLINKICRINVDENNIDLRSFILEIIELISLLGPITTLDLISIYKKIKGFETLKGFQSFGRRIRIKHIMDILSKFGLIRVNNGMLIPIKQQFGQPFMFDITRHHFNILRAKILTRKYKYGEGIIA